MNIRYTKCNNKLCTKRNKKWHSLCAYNWNAKTKKELIAQKKFELRDNGLYDHHR